MSRKQLTRLVERYHADNRTLHGPARATRQRELWDALATVGGEHDTGRLLALCDDVEPHVAVFDRESSLAMSTNHPECRYVRRHVANLKALNTRRFGKAVAS